MLICFYLSYIFEHLRDSSHPLSIKLFIFSIYIFIYLCFWLSMEVEIPKWGFDWGKPLYSPNNFPLLYVCMFLEGNSTTQRFDVYICYPFLLFKSLLYFFVSLLYIVYWHIILLCIFFSQSVWDYSVLCSCLHNTLTSMIKILIFKSITPYRLLLPFLNYISSLVGDIWIYVVKLALKGT